LPPIIELNPRLRPAGLPQPDAQLSYVWQGGG